jgi:hypothetical protein
LITKSNYVGSSTGRSPGFSPFEYAGDIDAGTPMSAGDARLIACRMVRNDRKSRASVSGSKSTNKLSKSY